MFVRQQVVALYTQVLADLGVAAGQQVGVVTFGTGPGTRIGPLAISGPAARSELVGKLPTALRPSAAEAAWTDWVAGVSGCEQMFRRSGDSRGRLVLLTDGFPQGPAGGPTAQLAAIAPAARRLWASGITVEPVLYGAGARQPGPARQAMIRLAALGHGKVVLAATPLDMLRAALSLASLSTGLPLGGSEVPVNGSTTVPLDIAPRVAAAVLVVLRSSSGLQVGLSAPGGKTLASAPAGTPGLGLVAGLTSPAAGSYRASADGQGSVFAAEVLRYAAVAAPAPGLTATSGRTPAGSRPAARPGSRSGSWLLPGMALGLAVLALACLAGWFVAGRRRPRGTLVVWWGSRSCLLDPADVNGLVPLEDLFGADGEPAGWSVSWTRRAPVAFGPGGSAVHLVPGETRTLPVAPLAGLSPGSPMAPTPPWRTSRREVPPAPDT